MSTADVKSILSAHRYVFDKPPEHTPADHSIDAPLLGNGDLGVAIGGNAACAVVNMSMRWFATYDTGYARKVYPFIKAVAEFWEDYLTWDSDGNRFVSESDSIHEGSGADINPILSLGLVRCVMRTVIEVSRELGIGPESDTELLESRVTRSTKCSALSHAGNIRLFHNWPRNRDASFSTLRAHGAFLVSSSLADGAVERVRIESERGRVCKIMNPWFES